LVIFTSKIYLKTLRFPKNNKNFLKTIEILKDVSEFPYFLKKCRQKNVSKGTNDGRLETLRLHSEGKSMGI